MFVDLELPLEHGVHLEHSSIREHVGLPGHGDPHLLVWDPVLVKATRPAPVVSHSEGGEVHRELKKEL